MTGRGQHGAVGQRVLTAAPNTTNMFVAEIDGAVVGFAAGLMLPEPKLGLDAELVGDLSRPRRAARGHRPAAGRAPSPPRSGRTARPG